MMALIVKPLIKLGSKMGCCQLIFLIAIFALVRSHPFLKDEEEVQIGCLKCHNVDKTKINVHLIPHSHNDVGWLKTYDQYYYGLNGSIQTASVQYIITTVVDALSRNPDRRFIQVETAFFWKWWKDQSEEWRVTFRSLVEGGQIEMVNGAWAMNDEACTNYQSTIDQFTWGLKLIDDTVGTCGRPKVGWQIDPFGHSRQQAAIFSQLGYDGIFFARLDYLDKLQRQNTTTLDLAWQGSSNLGNNTIFTSIFPTEIYYPPNGFCWDYLCSDETIDDDPESHSYNVERRMEEFKDVIKKYAKTVPTGNILIPMGGDFHYGSAESNFINMDRFIKGFDNDTALNIFYSTPSCYIKAVYDSNIKLKLKTDDFFPYSNDNHSFWAGFYTSRPNSKRFERTGHNFLQVFKQLYAVDSYLNGNDSQEKLHDLREAMGTLQHHDAITGTEKQHVTSDYVRLLHEAILQAEERIGHIVTSLFLNDSSLSLTSCLLSNVSICGLSQSSKPLLVAVYNPLAWTVTHYVRLPAAKATYNITGPEEEVHHAVVPTISDFSFVKIPNETPSLYELVFEATIPPLGFKTYLVETTSETNKPLEEPKAINGGIIFGDNNTGFTIDEKTNLLTSVTVNGLTLDIEQNFYYYNSETGEKDPKIPSGAYLFRPKEKAPTSLKGDVVKLRTFKTDLVEEFHQAWTDPAVDISQCIRVYKEGGYIEFDWIVGNIEIGDNKTGKEIITKFTVKNFNSTHGFDTDSNGKENIRRYLNYRPDYKYDSTIEPVASNYYPVTSRISIKDEDIDKEIVILNDRPQGGSSLSPNEIELMIHRRLFQDDNKGVGEPLNETEFGKGIYVRGSHYLLIGTANTDKTKTQAISTDAQARILAQKKLLQPWVGMVGMSKLSTSLVTSFSLLTEDLPENVNILTFEPWQDGTILLRLEHIMEQNEDDQLSKPVTVELKKLFKDITINDITETTLGANQPLEEIKRYPWKTVGTGWDTVPASPDQSKMNISLTPMQIRTFIVKVGNSDPGSFGVALKPTTFLVIFSSVFYLSFNIL